MEDILLVGVPLVGGVLLIIAGIGYGVQTHNMLFAIPPIAGAAATASALGVLTETPGIDSSLGWLSAMFWFVLGLIVLGVTGKTPHARAS